MMMRTRPLRPYRLAVAAASVVLYLALPFVRVGGASALRFDLQQLRLFFFGKSLWVDEFIIVLAAVLFLCFLFLWVTLVFGRLWCEWLCPQSVLVDLAGAVSGGRRGLFYVFSAVLGLVLSAATVWYFIPPEEFLLRLFDLSLGYVEAVVWLALALFLWLDTIFLGRIFCSTACPYAKLQGVVFDSHTMALAFDRVRQQECMECDACVRACPVGIDLRKGAHAGCFSCSACRDACAAKMEKKSEISLILHLFGKHKTGLHSLLRSKSLAVFLPVVFALLLFVGLISGHRDINIVVLPNHSFTSRMTSQGGVMASFFLALGNRTDKAVWLSLSSDGAALSPTRVLLGAADHRKIPVVVILKEPVDSLRLRLSKGDGQDVFQGTVRLAMPGGKI